jgi:hypothetical protein
MKCFKSSLLRISGCVALLIILTAPVDAANLEGVVTYEGSNVPYVLVSLYKTDTDRRIVTRTNNDGRYLFDDIPNGLYIILVEKEGRRIYQGKVNVPENGIMFDIEL